MAKKERKGPRLSTKQEAELNRLLPDDELKIPAFLLVKNRKPLTVEQQERVKAFLARGGNVAGETGVQQYKGYQVPKGALVDADELARFKERIDAMTNQKKIEVAERAEERKANKPPKPKKGPGIVATVIATISRPEGASIAEIMLVLKEHFPHKAVKGMTTTAKIQSKKNATTTKEDKKRGKVFYRTDKPVADAPKVKRVKK